MIEFYLFGVIYAWGWLVGQYEIEKGEPRHWFWIIWVWLGFLALLFPLWVSGIYIASFGRRKGWW